MNEGHASLLTLALLDEQLARDRRDKVTADDVAAVRRMCVFTTHTPVAAGHDQFPLDMVPGILGRHEITELQERLRLGRIR